MSENEAIDVILKDHSTFKNPMSKAYVMACKSLEEIQQYRALEQKLQSVYGEHDGLLEIIVNGLVQYDNAPDKAIKCVLLTDDDVEKWEQLKAIGTIEEFKDLKKKSEPKKPILNNPQINEFFVKETKLCPSCHSYINNCSGNYCRDCGQAIDWSK